MKTKEIRKEIKVLRKRYHQIMLTQQTLDDMADLTAVQVRRLERELWKRIA